MERSEKAPFNRKRLYTIKNGLFIGIYSIHHINIDIHFDNF